MKKAVFLAAMIVWAVSAWADEDFEHDAVLVENRSTSFVVRSSGYSTDKKKAAEIAAMSALDTYLFRGIEGVNGGKPLLAENAAELKPAYFERLYGGGRYSVFMRSVVEERKPQKQADGRYLAVMLVEISFKAVQRDIVTNKLLAYGEVAAEEKKPLDITEVKLPAVMVLPDLSAAGVVHQVFGYRHRVYVVRLAVPFPV